MPDTPAPRRASNYIDAETLRALVRDYRSGGVVSEPLAAVLLKIAGGVWDRYRYTADRDDFVQEVVMHLLQRPLEKVDVQKNLFAYLSTCAINFGRKLRDKAHVERRRFETYAAECQEAGRRIPRVRGRDQLEADDADE